MSKQISNERIEQFLQGTDSQKYIVAVEAEYSTPNVVVVVNDPETGKRKEVHKYKPFLWMKEEVMTKLLFGGKKMKMYDVAKRYDISFKTLITTNDEGYEPPRMSNGYKHLVTCKKSYNDLINFFKEGGIDIFHKDYSKYFVMFSPTEQFLIQTGKRLFKGMEDYNDVHRFQFDLETEGLLPSKNAIFQIGVRDNKGFEKVVEAKGNTPQERRDSERAMIELFFNIIDALDPDIITGYNSENFDWDFIFERAERLSIPINELLVNLSRLSKIKRKPATLKLGGETEAYTQTYAYGFNVIDISHAVRRAMAINSEIKSWGLKYITQYSGIAKPNRVYVPGDRINKTWEDKVNQYAFDDTNGDWYIIDEKHPLKDNYKIVTGAYIVQRYLQDDLWETEQVDYIFNQASFLISKMLPTSFMRSSTMGTAGQWKLIMSAWSYENGLAIPETQTKRDFTGGLSRLLEVGYARNVVKLDFAALYPKTQLTWSIFPDLDISGVMRGILTYVVDTRDHFKFLTGIEKKKAKKLQAKLDENKANMTQDEISVMKKEITEHKRLSNLYDKKQLPLKILANSWFGSYGAPYIFNWGDTDSAEETTCRGRQSLRLMVRHFTEKHGFKPLVGDTDGFNFSFPDNIDQIRYVAKGNHWKTKDDAGKELIGLDAVLAEFNENYMEGRMGLDIDDVCTSTINFARKNYANDIDGKIKLVGNSIKSKKMPVYIEEFLGKAIRMLLDGDGHSFINYYHEYVDKIYNYQIPLVKIASKAKVKTTITEYKKKANLKNKAGNPMPKQAHMELAIKHELNLNLGDTIYYVNIGTSKSQGDLKTLIRSKMTKKEVDEYFINNGCLPTFESQTQLNCKLIDNQIVEHDFEVLKELEAFKKSLALVEDDQKKEIEEKIQELETSLYVDDYNVARYLEAFNKKIHPLLVCFSPEIRDNITLSIVKSKDKTTKKTTEKLKERTIFTKQECELVSGMPFKDSDQDSYDDLMIMEDKEIKFWNKVNKLPNYMEPEKWEEIRADYLVRMEQEKIQGIQHEKDLLDNIFRRLEVSDLRQILNTETLPKSITNIAYITTDGTNKLASVKYNVDLCDTDDVFKYQDEAIERQKYYQLVNSEDQDNKYELWLDYIAERKGLSGYTGDLFMNAEPEVLIESLDTDKVARIAENSKSTAVDEEQQKATKTKSKSSESEDDDDDEETNGDDEALKLDDEFDDTQAERPEEDSSPTAIQEDEDEWPF